MVTFGSTRERVLQELCNGNPVFACFKLHLVRPERGYCKRACCICYASSLCCYIWFDPREGTASLRNSARQSVLAQVTFGSTRERVLQDDLTRRLHIASRRYIWFDPREGTARIPFVIT